jgi:hypothetical protein
MFFTLNDTKFHTHKYVKQRRKLVCLNIMILDETQENKKILNFMATRNSRI